MRILYDGRLLAAAASGVRDIAVGLLAGLSILENRGATEVLIAQTSQRTTAAEVVLPARAFMHVGLPVAAVKYGVDRILIPRQTIPIISRVPAVPFFYDIGFIRQPDLYPNEYQIEATTRMAARAKYGLAVSRFTAREMRESGLGCSIHALPISAIHSVTFSPNTAEPFLLCVAAQQPHKNLVRLIEAWELADTQGTRLVICGRKGKDSERIMNVFDRSPKKKSITLVSGLDNDEYLDLLQSSWGYVQPSLYEGLCIPALDLAAAGTPMIVSAFGNLGAVFSEAPTPQVFDPLSVRSIAESLEALISDNNFRQSSAAFNRSNVRITDWEQVAVDALAAMN